MFADCHDCYDRHPRGREINAQGVPLSILNTAHDVTPPSVRAPDLAQSDLCDFDDDSEVFERYE